MAARLAKGDFLLIVAGDELDPRAGRLGRAVLGDHMLNPWELAMVDVAVYRRTAGDGPLHLLVPAWRSTIVTETRNVIKVDVPATGGPPRVKIERLAPRTDGRTVWTRERFLAELQAERLEPSFKCLAERICAVEESPPYGFSVSWARATRARSH
jgi:hypothetical protein